MPSASTLRPVLRFVTESFSPPSFDTAVSAALLQRVDGGEVGATLRLFVPERSVAFGRQDRARPGYAEAVAAASAAGFTPVERLAGGRAAVFHEGTLAFALALPEKAPRETIHRRFEMVASALASALRSLGVNAQVGEVPGEYCPGRYSVSAAGKKKLVGIGQRLSRHAAHVGGVVVVDRPDLVNRPLAPVYDALGYEWDPTVTGAVTEDAATTVEEAREAIAAAFARDHHLDTAVVDDDTLRLAESLRPGYQPLTG